LGTRGEKLFKARLRLALERKGLKKIALAKHCRVVPSAVTGWLDDDGPSPEMSRLELIADFIGEEIAWFFTPLDDEVASLPDLIERAERLTRGIKELAAEGARKPPPKKS
jgi:transcriptional regulator with XRE-family HTH domain